MQPTPPKAITIATAMLKRRWIKPYPPAKNGDVVRALAPTIAATPARSPYGQALIRLFSGHYPYQGNERFIMHALRNGQPAYAHDVTTHAERYHRRAQQLAERTPTSDLNGPLTAKHIAGVHCSLRTGPRYHAARKARP